MVANGANGEREPGSGRSGAGDDDDQLELATYRGDTRTLLETASTDDLHAALEPTLSSYFGAQRCISELKRRPSDYYSSFAIEELDVCLDDDTTLHLVFKDLSWQGLLKDARRAKPAFLYDPLREIETYRTLLARHRLGTATCYGAVVDPQRGRYWLFLEKVAGVRLNHVDDFAIWQQLARWLAVMHTCFAEETESQAASQSPHLLHYDGDFYRLWLRRAVEYLGERAQDAQGESKTTAVEILDVSSQPDPERLRGSYIGLPKPGSRIDNDSFYLWGWVLGRNSPAVAVEVVHEGSVLLSVPVEHHRPKVAAYWPRVPYAEHCGFETPVSVVGMMHFELGVRAILQDQSRVPIGVIRGRCCGAGEDEHAGAAIASANAPQAVQHNLARLAERYDQVIERLVALPVTFIHGEFYSANVLVQETAEAPRLCPIDWETAAVGPGLIDLAALTAGRSSEEEKAALALAYYDALAPGDGWPPPQDAFLAALDCCRLHLAMQWLGWSQQWSPAPGKAQNWLSEALRLAEKLGLS